MNLNKHFIDTITNTFGDQGQNWLKQLPSLLEILQEQWQFDVISILPNLNYNFVALVEKRNNQKAILKCGVPNNELFNEIAALQIYHGMGAVSIFEADPLNAAFMLDYIDTGISLEKITSQDQATTIFVDIISELHTNKIPQTHSFPSLKDYFQTLMDAKSHPKLGHKLIDKAQNISTDLLCSMNSTVLLHADLHHQNILKKTNNVWLAIDPKGVIGEAEAEVGAFMRNPAPLLFTELNAKKILNERLHLLADKTSFDIKRLWGWSFSQSVIAAIWNYNDKGDLYNAFWQCAEILSDMNIRC